MERCATCKHWKTKNGVQGTCQAIDDEAGACDSGRQVQLGVKAQIQSADDMTLSRLVTLDDFGCVLHEPKE